MDAHHGEPAYREVQSFRQLWLLALLGGICALIWYAAVSQLLFETPLGNKPASNGLMIVLWLVVGVAMPLIFWSMNLAVEVRADGLYYRFFPFHWRFHAIEFATMKSCAARTYRPIVEYGGWGIRYGFQGKAYNVSGNQGVQLELTDGRRILFGSQRAEELCQAVQEGMKQVKFV